MVRGGQSLLSKASPWAIAACCGVVPGQSALALQIQTKQQVTGEQNAPRQISFTVPVVFNERVLGDVLVLIEPGVPTTIETSTLRTQLITILNDAGIEVLDQVIAGRPYILSEELAAAGFEIRFDENRLEVVVDTINGEYRPVASLGQEDYQSATESLPTVEPADFSAYVNFNTNFDYSSIEGVRNPEVFVFGAARYENVVVELDGAFSDQFGEDYRFYRRSFRAVYDQPEHHRRFSAGDLRIDTVPLLQTPFVGGIAVEKRRQIFNPLLPISRLGGREIFLDSRSTVDVLINGQQYQSFQLDAGTYDLANLPLQVGSNDVELRVRDSAGREQLINLDYFFEPLDLPVGEDEYAFSVAFVAEDLNFEPDYSDDPIAIGFYRRALTENLVLGGAAQISEDLQVFAAEATIVPQVIPGVFDLQFAASTGNGTGIAFRAGYRLRSGNSFSNQSQFSLTVDYESGDYRTVNEINPTNFDLLNFTASYTRSFSQDTFVSAGLSHTRRGGAQSDQTVAFVDVVHRLNDRFRLTGGVEYGDDQFTSDNFGVRVGISYIFGERTRVNADYRSRTRQTRATLSRGADNNVGSFGYDLGFNDSRGSTSADASADYVGNRFDARASFFTDGGSIGNITDDQRFRLQFGTSIALADGVVGVGRPINDAFAVVTPHSTLEDRRVISGRTLSDGDFYARSGVLGAAVQSDLSSYSTQDVQFDIDSLQPGYDIGDGVARVDPPYRAGYKIVVGNDRFVSAVGTLSIGGETASLISGIINSVDDEGFEPIPFFTNSVGRFGIIGLAPGQTYVVTIPSRGLNFTIDVPEDNTGLYRLGELNVPVESE